MAIQKLSISLGPQFVDLLTEIAEQPKPGSEDPKNDPIGASAAVRAALAAWAKEQLVRDGVDPKWLSQWDAWPRAIVEKFWQLHTTKGTNQGRKAAYRLEKPPASKAWQDAAPTGMVILHRSERFTHDGIERRIGDAAT